MESIKTIDDLKGYLYRAMQLEHATIPTYLTALYSLHPQTNSDAYHAIRVVVVEEMLHLTIAANLMNSIGGKVDLTQDGFLPPFPTYLPDGEDDFEVGLACFSPSTLDTFLSIERPDPAPDKGSRRVKHTNKAHSTLASALDDEDLRFYSIGDFYEEIEEGFRALHEELGDALFCGDESWQAGPEVYYSGGGKLRKVTDLESALASMELIKGQGEGNLDEPYDVQGELAHYYRFEQLKLGRYYQPGDEAHEPSGPPLEVDWSAVYPTLTNPRIERYAEDPELHEAAHDFNATYFGFLELLTKAFSGEPKLLLDAVPYMFRLRDGVNLLIRNPLPGSDAATDSAAFEPESGPAHAAPTFEFSEFTT